jgi:hypothetical protein
MEAYKKISDEAKRVASEMTMHAVNGNAGCWASFKLSDGTSDHEAYPDRILAVKVNKWDRDNYMYLEITPDGMQPKQAQALLEYYREFHDAGWRLPSPDFDYDPTMPMFDWDKKKTIAHLTSGGRLYPEG